MLDDGIYYQVNKYMFRPIVAIFRLRSQHHHAVYIYIYDTLLTKL